MAFRVRMIGLMFECVLNEFRVNGVAVARGVVDPTACEPMCDLIEPLLATGDRKRPGARDVLRRAEGLREAVEASQLVSLMNAAVGNGVKVVRAICFDKNAESNWMVPWHQDATIAVRERVEVDGFGPWAVKDGEHHCQPPREVMESIITLRLHLDDCAESSGPLRVIRGSHTLGLLDDLAIRTYVEQGELLTATAARGDVVITSPIAIHSSARSTTLGGRRRVLHLDCTNISLPGGLRWAEAL